MAAGKFVGRVKALLGFAGPLAAYRARVADINRRGEGLEKLSDDDLRARFAALRTRRQNGEAANPLLAETFAVVREASTRALGMRHFDEQLIGGMILFDGAIAEMKTGEGKTLAATLPVCLEAISGKGAHVVTVNDYLARRDAEWMGALYQFLGLTVGVNLPDMSVEDKAAAYQSDITYGTNNEFGFDYLRHNMRHTAVGIQRELNFAIVDEVDSILIDEARTPLIISGESNDNIDLYASVAALAGKFRRGETAEEDGDFYIDEKARAVQMSEAGFDRAEQLFADAGLMQPGGSLYEAGNLSLLHHLDVALRALYLFVCDRDYVVQDGQVIIVDEFTGRLMPGRRWGDNQHQAVEAKEKLAVQKESRTLASISFQNYFRLYGKLAGMTGTAMTEAEEFRFIYGLRTLEVPTHRNMVRRDELDRVYRGAAVKYRAVIEDIKDSNKRGQPVLVGTTAIEDSERLSGMLSEAGLRHNVLNAKNHAAEATIIAQAGAPAAITIATNMAGRGTDIVLGGNPAVERKQLEEDAKLPEEARQETDAAKTAALNAEWNKAHAAVVAAGGLRIIGTERHESRRIDNQLRGRSGRQGDDGSSAFYLSFEDSLLRIFATKHVSSLMEKLKMDDEAIEAKMVSRTIENAQRKVEAHNFDIRRQLLEYDDIANEQRRLIYEQREDILRADDIAAVARQFRLEHLEALFDKFFPPDSPEEEWRAADLERQLAGDYRIHVPLEEWVKTDARLPRADFLRRVIEAAEKDFAEKFDGVAGERFDQFVRSLILSVIDENWRGHLSGLDNLRQSIGFRGMAQKNPKQEYKREAFGMFSGLLETIQTTITKTLYGLRVRREDPPAPPIESGAELENLQYRHSSPENPLLAGDAPLGGTPPLGDVTATPRQPATATTIRRTGPKVQRNDPCPCGSGKKYKHCCGKI